MLIVERSRENPILLPDSRSAWEAQAVFNGTPVKEKRTVYMLFRALSYPEVWEGSYLPVSTIGYAKGPDGIHFGDHSQLIVPENEWERFGCEDPRVTKLDDTYFIFYTALSTFPFSADGIKVAVALSKDLKKITARHLVTPFNAKAMTLFPEKIGGKYAALLSVNTDRPPATIALAYFDKKEDIWSKTYWDEFYRTLPEHGLSLQRRPEDHIEIGAAPIRTDEGWLLIYSYIYNYGRPNQVFAIEAVLLDLHDPRVVRGHTRTPLLKPDEEYERYGMVPNIVFPSGAYVEQDKLHIYYGASDTTVCRATTSLSGLLKEVLAQDCCGPRLIRSTENPILTPLPEHAWESKAVFNPGAIELDGKVHLLYRAMGADDTSVVGYAVSEDGLTITERLPEPIYIPRMPFEGKTHPGNSGCEDPRLTLFGDRYYMCYTAFDGVNPPRVAITDIALEDFRKRAFDKWTEPKLISPPQMDNKDAALFPERINGKLVFLHRYQPDIHINFIDDFADLGGNHLLVSNPIMRPRLGMWDDAKIGLSSTPIKTKYGWLIIYHGVSSKDSVYRVGAALLDLKHPDKVIARTRDPLLEPEMPYELEGMVAHVVFPCGSLIRGKKLYIYYGGADTVIGVATMDAKTLLDYLRTS
jgi:predicted GH43/DUF377 family glycosyl hydrolase